MYRKRKERENPANYRGLYYVDDTGKVEPIVLNTGKNKLVSKVDSSFKKAFDKMMTTGLGQKICNELLNSKKHTILIKIARLNQALDYQIGELGNGGKTVFNCTKDLVGHYYTTGYMRSPSGIYKYFENTNIAQFMNADRQLIKNVHLIAYDKDHLDNLSLALIAEIVYHELTAHVYFDPKGIFISNNDSDPISRESEPQHVLFGLKYTKILFGNILQPKLGGYSKDADLEQGYTNAINMVQNHLAKWINEYSKPEKMKKYQFSTRQEIENYFNILKTKVENEGIKIFVEQIQ